MTADPAALTGVRWSSAAVCKRKAVYEHLKAPTTDVDQSVKDLWADRAEQSDRQTAKWAKRLRDQGHDVALEEPIPWECGIGHADLVDHTDRIVAEFVGTKGAELPERKCWQGAGYAAFLSRATGETYEAAVVSFDPATPSIERTYPLDESMRDKALAVAAEVEQAIATDTLPDRVCHSPGDNPAHYCPFAAHCFDGWEYPESKRYEDEDTVSLAERLVDAVDEAGITKKTLAAQADRVKALQEELKVRVEHGTDVIAGGVLMKISDIADGESFSLSDYTTAGHTLPDDMLPFVKPTKGYAKFTKLKRLA